jgi:hypothetical protein
LPELELNSLAKKYIASFALPSTLGILNAFIPAEDSSKLFGLTSMLCDISTWEAFVSCKLARFVLRNFVQKISAKLKN